MQRPLAIFDLDRTLHAGSGLGVLARIAFRHRLIGGRRMAHSLFHDMLFRKRGSTDGHTSSIAELALDMARGIPYAELEPLITAAADEIAGSVRPRMLELLHDHRIAGHYCVLLSASPQPLVEYVADRLDMGCAIGTLIEVDDEGVLTGRIEHPMCYGPGKLERLGTVTGWSSVTTTTTTPTTSTTTTTTTTSTADASFAYADSMSDLPLLESVGSPVVVTPDRSLRRLADERDWPVLDF